MKDIKNLNNQRDIIKVCFLDVDGVISTENSLYEELARYFGKTFEEIQEGSPIELCNETDLPYPNVNMYQWPFDMKVINRLYRLQLKTKCKWVMCSSWRLGRDIKEINNLMATKGCRLNFIDKTEVCRGTEEHHRGYEIKRWLKMNKDKYKVDSYVIIDDDCLYDIIQHHPNNCVTPKFKTGFTDNLLEESINILNK
jgi:hypothetical protein